MAKTDKKGGGRGRAPQTQAALPPSQHKGTLRRIAGLLSPTGVFWASVLLVAAFVSLYFLLRPQISVEPDVSLDPSNPNATLFRVTNQGVLPIYDITRDLNVESMSDAARNVVAKDLKMINWGPNIRKLAFGESTTLTMPTYISPLGPQRAALDIRYKYCDVFISCGYNDFFMFRHINAVRFQCIVGADGLAHWYHKGVSE